MATTRFEFSAPALLPQLLALSLLSWLPVMAVEEANAPFPTVDKPTTGAKK